MTNSLVAGRIYTKYINSPFNYLYYELFQMIIMHTPRAPPPPNQQCGKYVPPGPGFQGFEYFSRIYIILMYN